MWKSEVLHGLKKWIQWNLECNYSIIHLQHSSLLGKVMVILPSFRCQWCQDLHGFKLTVHKKSNSHTWGINFRCDCKDQDKKEKVLKMMQNQVNKFIISSNIASFNVDFHCRTCCCYCCLISSFEEIKSHSLLQQSKISKQLLWCTQIRENFFR